MINSFCIQASSNINKKTSSKSITILELWIGESLIYLCLSNYKNIKKKPLSISDFTSNNLKPATQFTFRYAILKLWVWCCKIALRSETCALRAKGDSFILHFQTYSQLKVSWGLQSSFWGVSGFQGHDYHKVAHHWLKVSSFEVFWWEHECIPLKSQHHLSDIIYVHLIPVAIFLNKLQDEKGQWIGQKYKIQRLSILWSQ